MSDKVIARITEQARRRNRRIVLPESADDRVLQAARQVQDRDYAKVTLLGRADHVHASARKLGVNLEDVEIVDPGADERKEAYAERLCRRRRRKGMTIEQARRLLDHPVYYGGMMVADGRADGMVAGSGCPTADTVRTRVARLACSVRTPKAWTRAGSILSAFPPKVSSPSSTGTRFMPQIGHWPGWFWITCGCMGQV